MAEEPDNLILSLLREARDATVERRAEIGAQILTFCSQDDPRYSRSVHLRALCGELILWRNALSHLERRLAAVAPCLLPDQV